MTEEEILKLVYLMVGDTAPTGSHGMDMDKIVPNIDLLGRVTTELLATLHLIATSYEYRDESSIKACGNKARWWLDFMDVEIMEDY